MKIENLTRRELQTLQNLVESMKLDCILREQAEEDSYMRSIHVWNERYYTELLGKISKAVEQEEAVKDAIDEMRGVKYQ